MQFSSLFDIDMLVNVKLDISYQKASNFKVANFIGLLNFIKKMAAEDGRIDFVSRSPLYPAAGSATGNIGILVL